jgi:hypothetical protein
MASIPPSAAIPIADHSDFHHPQAIELKTLDERNGGVSTVIGCGLVCPFGLWICGLVLSSDRPALFVEREYNAFGGICKSRPGGRRNAGNQFGTGFAYPFGYSDDKMTCSFTAEVVNGCNVPSFSCKYGKRWRPHGRIAAESKMAAKRLAGVGLPYRNNRPCLTFGHFHNPNSRKEAKCPGNSLLLYSCRHWRD